MSPQTESASSREQSELAAREAEAVAMRAESQEAAPDIPDEQSLEKFKDDRVGVLDESVADILRSGKLGLEMRSASLGLSQEETATAKQETGVDQALGDIQAELAQLQERAKSEMAQVAEGEKKPEMPPGPETAMFESLKQIREKAAVETDPNKALDLRAEATEAIRQGLPELSNDAAAETYIKEFNEKNPGVLKGMELTLVRGRGDKLMIVDESGNLKEISVSKDKATEALAEVKRLDAGLEKKGNSHDLRQEILKRSEGGLTSHDAYTYATEEIPARELDDYLADSKNWVPERQRLHQEIIDAEMQKAKDLASRLDKNTIYALRGNTAAGKTTALRSNPLFSRAGNTDGAINPDTYKASLKAADAEPDGWQNVLHKQAHEEGSMLAKKIFETVQKTEDASMIIDKRLSKQKNIKELLDAAESSGKKLKFLDVDAPLETSLIRVLGREPGGADPLVPFDAVAGGFNEVRSNRLAMLEAAEKNDSIETYTLYAPGPDGKPKLVASKEGGRIKVEDGMQDIFAQTVDEQAAKQTVDALKDTVIDDAYIERTVAAAPADQRGRIQSILEKNKGMTFKEALDQHAEKFNKAPPLDYYAGAAQLNLEATSRTAKGTVDTTASADKAEKMAAGLTGEKAAELAKGNFQQAVEKLYANRETQFNSPAELRAFVESIANTINGGILKEGTLIRQGQDSAKYPYTKVADLEKAMTQFYEELNERMNDPEEDAEAVAAWAEYRIDLTDHFYADGCGKTAKAVSSFVLMRRGEKLPQYSGRKEYYASAPTTARDLDQPSSADPQLDKFTAYFKQLKKRPLPT